MTWIIAGLGNPGDEYVGTRHNTGHIVSEFLLDSFDGGEWKVDKKTHSLVTKGSFKKETIMFVFPQTFMNKSGVAIKPLISSEKKAAQLIVIYDDLDLPVGTFRISFNRGSGGHRGLDSIIKALKTEKFLRIRVGISPETAGGKLKKPLSGSPVEKHILGKFKPEEQAALKKVSKKIAEALQVIMTESKEKAMTLFNSQR